jgi:hypothetical protein
MKTSGVSDFLCLSHTLDQELRHEVAWRVVPTIAHVLLCCGAHPQDLDALLTTLTPHSIPPGLTARRQFLFDGQRSKLSYGVE